MSVIVWRRLRTCSLTADATMVVPLDFLRIPLIAFVGWQFYGEALDPFVFLGSGCIIVGLLYSLHREARSA